MPAPRTFAPLKLRAFGPVACSSVNAAGAVAPQGYISPAPCRGRLVNSQGYAGALNALG
jgi:hypothetical protein